MEQNRIPKMIFKLNFVGRRRKGKSREQGMDGVTISTIGSDLTEEDAEQRFMAGQNFFRIMSTYCTVVKSQ